MRPFLVGVSLMLAVTATARMAFAAPSVPANDEIVVETLPFVAGWAREERRLRRELAQRPRDAGVAVAAAKAFLELARAQGDARYAGRADRSRIPCVSTWRGSSS